MNREIKFSYIAIIFSSKYNFTTMYNQAVTVRRIDVLIRILRGRKSILGVNNVRGYSSDDKITIGDVTKEISKPKNAEYVPRKYCKFHTNF